MQGVATPWGLEQALGRDLAALLANNSPSGYLRMLLGMWGALLRARVRNITRSVAVGRGGGCREDDSTFAFFCF